MSDTLSGFLVWTVWDAVKEALSKATRIRGEHDGLDGWRSYQYKVDEEIPRVDSRGDPPYVHSLMIRGGVDRVVILSRHARISDHFLDNDLKPLMHAPLRKADIKVHELVLKFAESGKARLEESTQNSLRDTSFSIEKPDHEQDEWTTFNSAYALGYAMARSDAFGGNLQKIEFEGDDLVTVSLFTDVIPFARFRNCGVRRRVLEDPGYPSSYELLRLGKAGFLSFSVPALPKGQRDRFREVEAVLRNLNKLGFIK